MSSQPVRSKWAISGGQEYIQVMMTAKQLDKTRATAAQPQTIRARTRLLEYHDNADRENQRECIMRIDYGWTSLATKGVVVSAAFGPRDVGGPACKITMYLVVMELAPVGGLIVFGTAGATSS